MEKSTMMDSLLIRQTSRPRTLPFIHYDEDSYWSADRLATQDRLGNNKKATALTTEVLRFSHASQAYAVSTTTLLYHL